MVFTFPPLAHLYRISRVLTIAPFPKHFPKGSFLFSHPFFNLFPRKVLSFFGTITLSSLAVLRKHGHYSYQFYIWTRTSLLRYRRLSETSFFFPPLHPRCTAFSFFPHFCALNTRRLEPTSFELWVTFRIPGMDNYPQRLATNGFGSLL